MHENGRGVPQDYKEAFKWFRLAAEHGHMGGIYKLGLMPEDRQGASQVHKESVEGNTKAQKKLGLVLSGLIVLLTVFLFSARKKKTEEERGRREKERQERQERLEQSRQKRENSGKNSSEKSRSYEEVLGLSSGWTKSDLKDAYKRKCHQTHPDRWELFK